MRDLEDMSRVLCGHSWTSVGDWVRAVHELADLNDNEVDKLTALHGTEPQLLPAK